MGFMCPQCHFQAFKKLKMLKGSYPLNHTWQAYSAKHTGNRCKIAKPLHKLKTQFSRKLCSHKLIFMIQ